MPNLLTTMLSCPSPDHFWGSPLELSIEFDQQIVLDVLQLSRDALVTKAQKLVQRFDPSVHEL